MTASATSGGWTTNTTLDELAAALRRCKSVVVVTHAKPDGDAAGSALAVARSLRCAGVGAEIWFTGPIPRWMPEIVGPTPFRELLPGKQLEPTDGRPLGATEPDRVVVVDTGSWSQLAELRSWLEKRAERTIIVDHHLHGDAGAGALRFIDTGAASCTQVLAGLCTRLCGVPNASHLAVDAAEALYLGLATDTGWFRYSSVKPATLRLAADLLEAGVDHTKLYRMIEQQDTPGRWRLLGRAMGSLELHTARESNDLATMVLTRRDFAETNADQNDTSGFADMALTISSVQVAAVLTEHAVGAGEPPLTKFSLRSKPGAQAVDVNEVCQKLGGGGHARAAGAKMRVGLEEAKRALLDAVRAEAKKV